MTQIIELITGNLVTVALLTIILELPFTCTAHIEYWKNIIVNLYTNLTLNIFLMVCGYELSYKVFNNYMIITYILEVIIPIVEIILYKILNCKDKKVILMTILANVFSFTFGLAIQQFKSYTTIILCIIAIILTIDIINIFNIRGRINTNEKQK